jgi:hypothetical protein
MINNLGRRHPALDRITRITPILHGLRAFGRGDLADDMRNRPTSSGPRDSRNTSGRPSFLSHGNVISTERALTIFRFRSQAMSVFGAAACNFAPEGIRYRQPGPSNCEAARLDEGSGVSGVGGAGPVAPDRRLNSYGELGRDYFRQARARASGRATRRTSSRGTGVRAAPVDASSTRAAAVSASARQPP